MNEYIKEMIKLFDSRFIAMTGARFQYYDNENNSLHIRFKGSNKSNAFTCSYNKGADLYNLRFIKTRGVQVKEVAEHKDVFVNDVLSIFEKETGLYTRL